MTGINKRSNDPKVDQKKLKVNPWYNTSSLIKMVSDAMPQGKKKKDDKKSK